MAPTTEIEDDIVATLWILLQQARAGQIQELFVMVRAEGELDYDFITMDTDDMLYELGTVILNERLETKKRPQ